MKYINKTIIMLWIVMFVFCTQTYAYSGGTLNYLGVIPEDVTDHTVVTREYLAYSVAAMVSPNTKMSPMDTEYEDVKADNAYSGYISFVSVLKLMSGDENGYFNPKEKVHISAAMKVVVSLLGYEAAALSKGGWPGGYVSVAQTLKLNRGVDTAEQTLTYGNLKKILANAFDVSLPEEVIYQKNGEVNSRISLSDSNDTYGEAKLMLTTYSGIVNDIDYDKHIAKIKIDWSKSSDRYSKGDVETFQIWEGVNTAFYENVPVEFVVYNDEVIVDMVPQKGISIRFGIIDSVNHDSDDVAYSTKYINAMTLQNDDTHYKFSDACIFIVDDVEFRGALQLIGDYVKIVEKDNEILALSTWTLREGGIITKANAKCINYQNGNDNKRIDKLSEVKELFVVIDHEARTIGELKEGMTFYYYRDAEKNILVIIASQVRINDTLYSIDTLNKSLCLGNLTIDYVSNICSSGDGAVYQIGSEALQNYCGADITAILDIYGRASYIIKYSGDSAASSFIGYVLGYMAAKGLEDEKIQILNTETDEGTKQVYELSKKVYYKDDLSKADVLASINTTDGSALYEIELNKAGEIKSFSKLKEYEGFEGQTWSGGWGGFASSGILKLTVNDIVKRLYAERKTPVLCIYPYDGEVEFHRLTYGDLMGHYCNSGISLKFYGYEDNPALRMAVMLGNIHVVSSGKKSGFVDKCGTTLNDEQDEVTCVTIDGKTYELSEESEVQSPQTGELVTYQVSLFDNSLRITESLNLNGDLSLWNGKQVGNTKMYFYGAVEKADQYKITLEGSTNGSLCFYYLQGGIQFKRINRWGKVTDDADYQDLEKGTEALLELTRLNTDDGYSIERVFIKEK